MPRDNVSQTDFYLFFLRGGRFKIFLSQKWCRRCKKVCKSCEITQHFVNVINMLEHSETERTEIVQSFLIMIAVSF